MILEDHILSIRDQCDLLNVSRSSVYYCPKEAFEQTQIMNEMSEIHGKWPFYGYRKIRHVLMEKGIIINHKRVKRLMKLMGIKALYPGPKTSIQNRENKVFPYLLKGLNIDRPNQVWGTDITYIKIPTGMVYLFALLDWKSRFIVAYKLVNTMDAFHGVEVLEDAFSKYGIPEIANSDQGSQFTGILWIAILENRGVKISHNGVGRCIDNVRVERFWRTIKYEDIHLKAYDTLLETKAGIKSFIEYYNYERPHQALGYKTPAEVYFAP
jgi:putative transposase